MDGGIAMNGRRSRAASTVNGSGAAPAIPSLQTGNSSPVARDVQNTRRLSASSAPSDRRSAFSSSSAASGVYVSPFIASAMGMNSIQLGGGSAASGAGISGALTGATAVLSPRAEQRKRRSGSGVSDASAPRDIPQQATLSMREPEAAQGVLQADLQAESARLRAELQSAYDVIDGLSFELASVHDSAIHGGVSDTSVPHDESSTTCTAGDEQITQLGSPQRWQGRQGHGSETGAGLLLSPGRDRPAWAAIDGLRIELSASQDTARKACEKVLTLEGEIVRLREEVEKAAALHADNGGQGQVVGPSWTVVKHDADTRVSSLLAEHAAAIASLKSDADMDMACVLSFHKAQLRSVQERHEAEIMAERGRRSGLEAEAASASQRAAVAQAAAVASDARARDAMQQQQVAETRACTAESRAQASELRAEDLAAQLAFAPTTGITSTESAQSAAHLRSLTEQVQSLSTALGAAEERLAKRESITRAAMEAVKLAERSHAENMSKHEAARAALQAEVTTLSAEVLALRARDDEIEGAQTASRAAEDEERRHVEGVLTQQVETAEMSFQRSQVGLVAAEARAAQDRESRMVTEEKLQAMVAECDKLKAQLNSLTDSSETARAFARIHELEHDMHSAREAWRSTEIAASAAQGQVALLTGQLLDAHGMLRDARRELADMRAIVVRVEVAEDFAAKFSGQLEAAVEESTRAGEAERKANAELSLAREELIEARQSAALADATLSAAKTEFESVTAQHASLLYELKGQAGTLAGALTAVQAQRDTEEAAWASARAALQEQLQSSHAECGAWKMAHDGLLPSVLEAGTVLDGLEEALLRMGGGAGHSLLELPHGNDPAQDGGFNRVVTPLSTTDVSPLPVSLPPSLPPSMAPAQLRLRLSVLSEAAMSLARRTGSAESSVTALLDKVAELGGEREMRESMLRRLKRQVESSEGEMQVARAAERSARETAAALQEALAASKTREKQAVGLVGKLRDEAQHAKAAAGAARADVDALSLLAASLQDELTAAQARRARADSSGGVASGVHISTPAPAPPSPGNGNGEGEGLAEGKDGERAGVSPAVTPSRSPAPPSRAPSKAKAGPTPSHLSMPPTAPIPVPSSTTAAGSGTARPVLAEDTGASAEAEGVDVLDVSVPPTATTSAVSEGQAGQRVNIVVMDSSLSLDSVGPMGSKRESGRFGPGQGIGAASPQADATSADAAASLPGTGPPSTPSSITSIARPVGRSLLSRLSGIVSVRALGTGEGKGYLQGQGEGPPVPLLPLAPPLTPGLSRLYSEPQGIGFNPSAAVQASPAPHRRKAALARVLALGQAQAAASVSVEGSGLAIDSDREEPIQGVSPGRPWDARAAGSGSPAAVSSARPGVASAPSVYRAMA